MLCLRGPNPARVVVPFLRDYTLFKRFPWYSEQFGTCVHIPCCVATNANFEGYASAFRRSYEPDWNYYDDYSPYNAEWFSGGGTFVSKYLYKFVASFWDWWSSDKRTYFVAIYLDRLKLDGTWNTTTREESIFYSYDPNITSSEQEYKTTGKFTKRKN